MKIVVIGAADFYNNLNAGQDHIQWILVPADSPLEALSKCAAIFFEKAPSNLEAYSALSIPVFVNSVNSTLPVFENLIRFNGWPGFIEQESWELCGEMNDRARLVLQQLNKKFISCADEPGFISPRIISMIINEAFWTKADGVSTEDEIDTAMKLGTNYPFGPFEWAEKIGVKNVVELLEKLAENDNRYQPAPGLKQI